MLYTTIIKLMFGKKMNLSLELQTAVNKGYCSTLSTDRIMTHVIIILIES